MKNLFSQFFSLITYRFYLSITCIPIYIRHPRLCLLEIFYLLEESIAFILVPIYSLYLRKKGLSLSQSIYGTLPFSSWKTILSSININQNTQIIDLGSGKGKGLLYASIVHNCHCLGIEFNRYYTRIHRLFKCILAPFNETIIKNQDISTTQLPKSDVLFISGLGFSKYLLAHIQKNINTTCVASIIISIDVQFKLKNYTESSQILPSSWGQSIAYTYKKN